MKLEQAEIAQLKQEIRKLKAQLAAAEAHEFDGMIVDETSRLTRVPWELPRILEDLLLASSSYWRKISTAATRRRSSGRDLQRHRPTGTAEDQGANASGAS